MSAFVIPIPRELPARVAVDPDLTALYMDETGQSERIVSAFLAFDLEPPHAAHTLTHGFSSFESRVLAATAPDSPTYIEG